MKLTIQRVGGMLPTLRPTCSHNLSDLDAATRAQLLAFMRDTPPASAAPYPDAMPYVFELAAAGKVQTVSAAYDDVPPSLRLLLPGPR